MTPIRVSRDFRLLTIGGICSSLGTQAVLVALPYQIYVLSHSATLVGLLGAFELGPMIVVSLLGGAMADRHDRRLMLAVAQVGVIVVRGAVRAVFAVADRRCCAPDPRGPARRAARRSTASPAARSFRGSSGRSRLRPGLAFNYGIQQATGIIGPGPSAGVLIGARPASR